MSLMKPLFHRTTILEMPQLKAICSHIKELQEYKKGFWIYDSLDSDDDFETQPCSKKRKITQGDVEKKLDAVMNELFEVKEIMTEMMTLQKTTQIPLSLLKIMRDTFQCSILSRCSCKTTCNHHKML